MTTPLTFGQPFERLMIGMIWAMAGVMLSAIIAETGVGAAESVAIGIAIAPAVIAGLYLLGTIGQWAINEVSSQ